MDGKGEGQPRPRLSLHPPKSPEHSRLSSRDTECAGAEGSPGEPSGETQRLLTKFLIYTLLRSPLCRAGMCSDRPQKGRLRGPGRLLDPK